VESEKVVDMTVLVFGVVNILAPLHKLTVATYFIRYKIFKDICPLLAQFGIDTKNLEDLGYVAIG
jgi:hypothetical protein